MTYYLLVLACVGLGFFVTELIRPILNKKKIIVTVKHSDGSITNIEIIKGRDPEVDELIKQAKNAKGRAV